MADPVEDPALKHAAATAAVAKAQADARKAAADADSAEVTARGAALKAAIGEIPPSGFGGGVTTTDGAALAESNALAITAMIAVAGLVADGVAAAAGTRTRIYLAATDDPPARTVAKAYDFQSKLVDRALDDAIALSATVAGPAKPVVTTRFVGLTTTGLVLSGISAVLGYARSDFTLGGNVPTPSERALLSAIGGKLAARQLTMRIDGAPPPVDEATLTALVGEIEVLASKAARAREAAASHAAAIAKLSAVPSSATPKPKPGAGAAGVIAGAVASAPADPPAPHNPDPHGDRPGHERALAVLDDAVAMFDGVHASLLADRAGAPLVLRIAEARELDAFLAETGGAVALVRLDGAWSSTISRKNLWSGLLGRVPFEVNALVTASWRCFGGTSLTLLGAGVESNLRDYTPLLDVTLAAYPLPVIPAQAGMTRVRDDERDNHR